MEKSPFYSQPPGPLSGIKIASMSFGRRHKKLTRDSFFPNSFSFFFTILFAGLLCITGYKISLEPSVPSVGQVSSEGFLKWCKRRFWHAPRKRKVKLLKDLKESPRGTYLNGVGWKVFRFKVLSIVLNCISEAIPNILDVNVHIPFQFLPFAVWKALQIIPNFFLCHLKLYPSRASTLRHIWPSLIVTVENSFSTFPSNFRTHNRPNPLASEQKESQE